MQSDKKMTPWDKVENVQILKKKRKEKKRKIANLDKLVRKAKNSLNDQTHISELIDKNLNTIITLSFFIEVPFGNHHSNLVNN